MASIRTSVSGRKLCAAPRYPTRFWWYLAEDMTSRTWNDAQDMSWPIISRYMSLRSAVALRSRGILSAILAWHRRPQGAESGIRGSGRSYPYPSRGSRRGTP